MASISIDYHPGRNAPIRITTDPECLALEIGDVIIYPLPVHLHKLHEVVGEWLAAQESQGSAPETITAPDGTVLHQVR